MSESYKLTGTIHSMGQTTEYGSRGFIKREFVVKLTGEGENEAYPNYIALELTKDRCALLDSFEVGAEVEAAYNLTGRLWAAPGKPERCFNGLQVWKLSAVDNGQGQQSNPEDFDEARYMPDLPEDSSEIPF